MTGSSTTGSSTQGIRTFLHPRVRPGDGQGGVRGPVWRPAADRRSYYVGFEAEGQHKEPTRRRWRPPGGHRHRPRRQRPRAASGPVSADAPALSVLAAVERRDSRPRRAWKASTDSSATPRTNCTCARSGGAPRPPEPLARTPHRIHYVNYPLSGPPLPVLGSCRASRSCLGERRVLSH
jgi:hypothetical protein